MKTAALTLLVSNVFAETRIAPPTIGGSCDAVGGATVTQNCEASCDPKDCVVETMLVIDSKPGQSTIPHFELTCSCQPKAAVGDACPTTEYFWEYNTDVTDCNNACTDTQDCTVQAFLPAADATTKNTITCSCTERPEVCPGEQKECWDGSFVGQDSANGCAFEACPLPPTAGICDAQKLSNDGFKLVETCCEGDDKSLCPEHKNCRVAEVTTNDQDEHEIKCRCVADVAENDQCDADLLYPKTTECEDDCQDCRVKTVTGAAASASVECGCVQCDPKCACPSYDDPENYCREYPPTVGATTGKYEVSVSGDATYEIEAADAAEICSGDGDAPSGNLCPKKDDVAVKHCRSGLMAYHAADDTCVAPEHAVCMKLKTTDTWGCVFPSNGNEKRGCLTENVCAEYHVKNDDGQCIMNDAGYPVCDQEKTDVNTEDMPAAEAKVEYTTSYKAESFGVITNVLSLIVGMFTTAVAIVASL